MEKENTYRTSSFSVSSHTLSGPWYSSIFKNILDHIPVCWPWNWQMCIRLCDQVVSPITSMWVTCFRRASLVCSCSVQALMLISLVLLRQVSLFLHHWTAIQQVFPGDGWNIRDIILIALHHEEDSKYYVRCMSASDLWSILELFPQDEPWDRPFFSNFSVWSFGLVIQIT